jgi:hypothetical protein
MLVPRVTKEEAGKTMVSVQALTHPHPTLHFKVWPAQLTKGLADSPPLCFFFYFHDVMPLTQMSSITFATDG